ncbi:hypothetical protein V6U81_14600 [Micromonospora sp. CPCC 205711]|uniref:hypothetical protein n=1 Tax=Micromonospora sp. CPCC 205547 TaxID=3122400 RepID=UPI002FEE857D
MKAKSLIGRVAFVSALAGVASLFAVTPASAHWTTWVKDRNSCRYSGGTVTDHSYAWTEKQFGSCAGHAWLYTKTNKGVIWSGDSASLVGHYAPSGSYFTLVGHKSQSGESYTYYSH